VEPTIPTIGQTYAGKKEDKKKKRLQESYTIAPLLAVYRRGLERISLQAFLRPISRGSAFEDYAGGLAFVAARLLGLAGK